MTYSTPKDVYTAEDLLKLVKSDETVRASITVRGEYLKELVGVRKIDGSLGSADSKLESFGALEEVTGDVWFSIHTVAPLVTSLGRLETVGGDLNLKDLRLKSLGGLRRVGGNLNLRNVPLEDLGRLEFVGGNVLLSKSLEGRLDLSRIEIRGKVKYFNDKKSRLDDIPETACVLAESEVPVPLWKKTYAYSTEVLDAADAEQLEFYRHFKQSFLDGRVLDVRGNSNYVFALMFELLKEFRRHRDEGLIRRQLTLLGDAYPVIRGYAEDNLADAIEGRPERLSPNATLSIALNQSFNEAFERAMREHPDVFGEAGAVDLIDTDDFDDDEDAGEPGGDEMDDMLDDDELDVVETYDFPPGRPVYTVELTEERDEDGECLETNLSINGRRVASLGARVGSLKADVAAGRLFIQTLHSENEDSFSVFCFELPSGRRLWQAREVPPGGSLFIDRASRAVEAGMTYGYDETYLVRLDYEGNVLGRNFRDGYEMIAAAERHLADREYEQAKGLFLRALETKVSANTKIKAAKKVARIGKETGDAALAAQFAERAAAFEAGKEAEKSAGRRRRAGDEPPRMSAAQEDYWNKRLKQAEEEGGS